MWPRMRLFRAFSRTCFVNGPTQCFPLSLPTGSGMQPSALGWLRLSVHWLIRSHGGADAVRSASTVGKPLLKPGAAEPLGVGQRVRGPAVETCRRPLGKREAESAGSRVGRWQLLLGPFLSTKGQTVRPLSIEPRSRGVQLRADVPLFTHRPSHMHFISPKFPAVLRTEFVTKLTPSLKFLFREQKCHSFFLSSGILSDFHRATTEGGSADSGKCPPPHCNLRFHQNYTLLSTSFSRDLRQKEKETLALISRAARAGRRAQGLAFPPACLSPAAQGWLDRFCREDSTKNLQESGFCHFPAPLAGEETSSEPGAASTHVEHTYITHGDSSGRRGFSEIIFSLKMSDVTAFFFF